MVVIRKFDFSLEERESRLLILIYWLSHKINKHAHNPLDDGRIVCMCVLAYYSRFVSNRNLMFGV